MSQHFEIIRKTKLAPDVFRIDVRAEKIALKHQPGQFVILRVSEDGERFPLTIADANTQEGTITLIFQAVGKSTLLLASLEVGESILDLVGPLGKPSHIGKFGTVCCVGGGIGTAPLLPIARAMKAQGNCTLAILGARTKDLLILEDEFQRFCDAVKVCTDDGSYGQKGFVTDALKKILAAEKVDLVVAIGPVPMMKAVCGVTKSAGTGGAGIPTIVSLNPIMVDGTGMCGGCRVLIGGEVRFACVDGPEFDGHLVDFDNLAKRLKMYRQKETKDEEACKIGLKK